MKPRVPATEDGIQIVVERTSPSLQEEMCPFGRPLHLLFLEVSPIPGIAGSRHGLCVLLPIFPDGESDSP